MSKFKKAYTNFENKILTKVLIVFLILFSLLSIYVYLETQTNYLNYL
jgi:hypothetical protein